MGTNIRSVTVRLNAEVVKYIADMRLAGRETTRAFSTSGTVLASTNKELGTTSTRLTDVASKARVTSTSVRGLDRDTDRLGTTATRTSNKLDRMSGRVKLIAQAIALLGPAAIPIAAVAVPALTGLASALGFTVLAGGGAALALNGVADAFKAVEKARLEPTAENLAAARLELERMAPAGRALIRELQSLRDEWADLRATAQQGLFPGAITGLEALESRIPQVERIIFRVNRTLGQILAEGGESLSSDRWDDFFTFLETDASSALKDIAALLGSTGHAAAELWMAFDPVNDDFTTWLRDSAADLDRWATRLDSTDGFAEFIDYIRTNGPQVADTLGAIGGAFIDIGVAAAPVGGPVLQTLEAVARVISVIAESDFGTPLIVGLAAMSAFSRATALWGTVSKTAAGQFVAGQVAAAGALRSSSGIVRAGSLAQLGKGAALMGGLAIASSGAAEKVGLQNTATLALAGSLAGPWGAAAGAAIGLTLDLTKGQHEAAGSADEFTATLQAQTGELTRNSAAWVATKLQAGGYLDVADRLGVSQGQLINTILAGTDASNEFVDSLVNVDEAMQLDPEYRGDVQDLGSKMLSLSEVVDDGRSKFDAIAEAQAIASDAAAQNSSIVRENTAAHQANIEAMRTERAETLRAANAKINYQASILDARDALKENGQTLDITTRKGQANRRALLSMADAWNQQSDAAKSTQGAHKQAVATFVEVARQMGLNKDAAREYALRLLEIPHGVTRVSTPTLTGLSSTSRLSVLAWPAWTVRRRTPTSAQSARAGSGHKMVSHRAGTPGTAENMSRPGSCTAANSSSPKRSSNATSPC